jgi:hypothetical protein
MMPLSSPLTKSSTISPTIIFNPSQFPTTKMMKICGNSWAISKRESTKKPWEGNSHSSEDDLQPTNNSPKMKITKVPIAL